MLRRASRTPPVGMRGHVRDRSIDRHDRRALDALPGRGWQTYAAMGVTATATFFACLVLHELGHAIQDAICPDFGQSREAAAMGEGFGDYFAASFFAGRKPERYRTSVMSWDGLHAGLNARLDPPCLRRVDLPLTYRDFHERGDEHDNGQIWSATL